MIIKKAVGLILKILKILLGVAVAAVAVFLAVRAVGVGLNRRTPKGGINESMYVEVNGTRQWINIYGENRENPVLLYLHGGPGSATSDIDYAVTRKWADVYTVVTWDQRNCGKSYDKKQNSTVLTRDLFLRDGRELTEFLLEYLSKEKIAILGHSWGTIYGANLVLEYPEYYDCFIGAGQLVDIAENEEAFIREASRWAGNDIDSLRLVRQLSADSFTMEHIAAKNALMEKYGYGMMVNGADYNLAATVIFNPNYSLTDWVKYFFRDMSVYIDFFNSEEFRSFSLKDRTKYRVSYYNINGDKDYQTNYRLAQEYFDRIDAPRKELFLMKNMTHGLLESRSAEFSDIVHRIAERERSDEKPEYGACD